MLMIFEIFFIISLQFKTVIGLLRSIHYFVKHYYFHLVLLCHFFEEMLNFHCYTLVSNHSYRILTLYCYQDVWFTYTA